MKTYLPLLLAFACLPAFAQPNDYAETTYVKVGDAAPEVSGQTLDGTEFSLSGSKGKVVLVNFFATWCGPCIEEMPHLKKEIQDVYGDREDFALIVVGREHSAQELELFEKQHQFGLPLLPDPARKIYSKYAEGYIPRNFLIGKDGTIKYYSVGFSKQDFEELLAVIKQELEAESP